MNAYYSTLGQGSKGALTEFWTFLEEKLPIGPKIVHFPKDYMSPMKSVMG